MSSGYLAAASFAQRQLRYLDLLQPGRAGYAVPLLVEIAGPADARALQAAFAAVVERHDVLRASFPLVDGVPALAVRDEVRITLPTIAVAAATPAEWRQAFAAVAAELAARPFDLESGPVLAAALAVPERPAAAGCAMGLAVVFHHAVADGASLPIFLRDLVAAYDGERTGEGPAWQDLPLQYPDYADWEQEEFGAPGAPHLAAAERHWREALRDVPALLDLPLDRRRAAAEPGPGATARLDLPPEVGQALTEAARQRGATPFMAFLAVFFAMLHRWSGLEDLVVTVPVSKRSRPELSSLIGLLVDTLPLRVACGADTRFDALLDAVRQTFLEAVRHRDVPFQRIVQAIGIERRADVVPLMQVLFGGLEPAGEPLAAADGCRFRTIDDGLEQTAKADLSLVYRLSPDRTELWCRYDPALFDRATVDDLLAWFGTVAAEVAHDPARPIGDLPLIGEEAGRALIGRFNRTRRPYPAETALFPLFADTARRHAGRPAIDEDGRVTTYGELARRAERLAAALAAAGVGRGDPVVMVVPLSGRFIALVLAILRLGAVYVPLDPAHPHARRAALAAAAGARAVILAEGEAETAYGGIPVLTAEALEHAAEDGLVPAAPPDPGATAYVMFTSGSTGEPKGVAVPHRAILRLVCNPDFAAFGPETRAAIHSNPSFDASTLEIWAPLLNGGTAVVIDRRAMLDVAELRRILAERDITLLWITAGLFHEIAGLDPSVFAGPRLVMTGGDVVNPDAARAVLAAGAGSGLRLLNGYGPTENTTFSTTFDIGALGRDDVAVPIGRPIANSAVYILDRNGRPLPAGMIGEIHVGGDGVAAGYVGDPGRTASAFLPDPFDGRPDARMYRTGDFGRWRHDGTVLFAGRVDDQVKVRGFRIELNEIAAALGRHPALRAAHVAAPRQPGGERHIVAYVVPRAAPAPPAGELRAFLADALPPHMLPHAYVPVERLTLNLNGKVDRRALPAVEDHHYDRAQSLVAPRSGDEQALADIWRDLLGLHEVGVTDSFFHVGGDSILAIRMAARAAEAGLPLTPTDVFRLQTIERLAETARAAQPRPRRAAADRAFPAELVPLADLPAVVRPFRLVSLTFGRRVDLVELAVALQRLAEGHEALRLRLFRDGEARRIEIAAYVARLPIRTVEVPDLADAEVHRWVAAHAARIGRGLDMASGVTLAATLVDRGPALGSVVVAALHRAVADDRTLALVASALEIAIRTGHAAAAPAGATTSYGEWLDWLEAHADRQAAEGGLARLEAPAMRAAASPWLADGAADPEAIAAERWLDAATTTAILRDAPAVLAVAPLDILVTALAATLPASGEAVRIEAVDGQRQLPDGAPDVEALAGNLDSVFAILAPTAAMPVGDRLRAVKAARQDVAPTAPVYRTLGRTFDLPEAAVGVALSAAPGDPGGVRLHALPGFGPAVRGALVATAAGGRLRLAWTGAEPLDGAAALLEHAAAVLGEIAELARGAGRPLHTPGDFPLAELTPAALDRIVGAASDVEDIYPLSPMQEAMLVHTLAAAHSEVNFEQSCMRIRGPLDHEAFRHAWTTVFERHAVLRTSFHWRGLGRPLQVVHRAVPLPLMIERWLEFDAARLEAYLAADRARRFDLERAPLVRLHFIQVAEDDVYIVSSFHHLLVDGWCLGRLEREIRAAYETYRSGRRPLLEASVPYRSYIAWLARTDGDAGRRFFADLLRDLPARRRLFPPARQPASGFVTARRTMDPAASRALAAFARRRGMTLAATVHLAWAVWLAARLGSEEVVFGTTVSGRPAAVPGVDGIIGLFINNLPVRLRVTDGDRPAERLAALHGLLGQLHEHAHLSPTAIAEAASRDESGPLFDTLVVVENVASGTSAWSGAEGLAVEAVHSRLKTAYDLTLVAVPGDALALSLVQPQDGRALEDGDAVLETVAAILAALPAAADGAVAALPRPPARSPVAIADTARAAPARFATRPRSTLEAQIADAVADLVPPDGAAGAISLDEDFWRMGIASLELIQLARRLEQRLERPVPIALLIEHRSVAALARAIAAGQRWSAVVPMNGGGRAGVDPFVCVHPVAGDVSVFLDLARAMPKNVPFWAIQAAGLEDGQEPLDSVEALAAANLQALAERGLARPRRIGGYSFGGVVAFEMARQLARAGTPPDRLVIIDTPAPLERASILPADADRAHAEWLVRMADVRARFQDVDPVLTTEELLRLPPAYRFGFAADRLRRAGLVPPAVDADWLRRAHRTSLVQYRAYLSYAPDPAEARGLPLAVIRAAAPHAADLGETERRQLASPDLGWAAFTDAPVGVREVAGDHVTMLAAGSADAVAAAVADLLAEAEARA